MSSDYITNFASILSSNGYRLTTTRIAVFKLLMNPEPKSMNELIKTSANKIDRVSLYRSIELFEKLGVVHRVHVGWKYKLELSEDFISHHHHLSCISCGKLIDIEDEQHVDEFIAELAKKFKFKPRRHVFEVDGYCNECS